MVIKAVLGWNPCSVEHIRSASSSGTTFEHACPDTFQAAAWLFHKLVQRATVPAAADTLLPIVQVRAWSGLVKI